MNSNQTILNRMNQSKIIQNGPVSHSGQSNQMQLPSLKSSKTNQNSPKAYNADPHSSSNSQFTNDSANRASPSTQGREKYLESVRPSSAHPYRMPSQSIQSPYSPQAYQQKSVKASQLENSTHSSCGLSPEMTRLKLGYSGENPENQTSTSQPSEEYLKDQSAEEQE